MMSFVGKERRIFGGNAIFECLKKGNNAKYLVTEVLFEVNDSDVLDDLIATANKRKVAKGYLAVSFNSKDTLMKLTKYDQNDEDYGPIDDLYLGETTLLVSVAQGDEVLIWDPKKQKDQTKEPQSKKKSDTSEEKEAKSIDIKDEIHGKVVAVLNSVD